MPEPEPENDLHPKKVMLSIWWDFQGAIYYELLPPNTTIDSKLYCTQLESLNVALKTKRPERRKCDHLFQQDDNEHLSFPIHHKHKRDNHLLSLQNLDDIDQLDVEDIISSSYSEALELIERLEISRLLQENDVIGRDVRTVTPLVFGLNSLSKYVFKQLNSRPKMFDYSTHIINDDDDDEFDLEEEEENDNSDIVNELNSDVTFDEEDDNDYNMTTIKSNFNGMKIFDEIETCRRDSYFKLKINDSYKYIHKQLACWLLTDKNTRLSNDRLSRVIQSSRKDNTNRF
ncbi:unnamed protein product [Rotaria magnacalcarata]|nr:unnamed protein product [Rotaria magnacalcarata]